MFQTHAISELAARQPFHLDSASGPIGESKSDEASTNCAHAHECLNNYRCLRRDIRGRFTTELSRNVRLDLHLTEWSADRRLQRFHVPALEAFGILRRTIRCIRGLQLILANAGGSFGPGDRPRSSHG